jgi:hypothetical protein
MPLWIIKFAALLIAICGSTFGAGFIRDLTFIVEGSNRDLFIQRLATTPTYLPFSSKTAITGGISLCVLKTSMHLEIGSSWLTVGKSPFVQISPTRICLIITFPPARY